MHEYALWQTATLLRRLAKQASQTARSSEPDAIHDLRVAIRRMKGCLALFAAFYPPRVRKALKKQLTDLMDACGEVRDRDIALRLLADAGAPAKSAAVRRLAAQRKGAAGELVVVLKPWKKGRTSRRWRTRLEM
jgi:CHAD domain-containing protein